MSGRVALAAVREWCDCGGERWALIVTGDPEREVRSWRSHNPRVTGVEMIGLVAHDVAGKRIIAAVCGDGRRWAAGDIKAVTERARAEAAKLGEPLMTCAEALHGALDRMRAR